MSVKKKLLKVTEMNFTIEQLPVQSIVYMRRTGAYGSENYKLMTALKEWAGRKRLFKDSIIYGIAHDSENTPPQECRYDVCLVAAADCLVDESVRRGEIPSGKYAVFTIPHTAETIQEFWASVIQKLQKQGLQLDTEKPILERYQYKLVADGKCEFCIPVI
jgi:DNA gyrase inhibitor GyrI